MWQCASQAPGGGVYFGLTGFGSGPGIGLVIPLRLLDPRALDDAFPLGDLRREQLVRDPGRPPGRKRDQGV